MKRKMKNLIALRAPDGTFVGNLPITEKKMEVVKELIDASNSYRNDGKIVCLVRDSDRDPSYSDPDLDYWDLEIRSDLIVD